MAPCFSGRFFAFMFLKEGFFDLKKGKFVLNTRKGRIKGLVGSGLKVKYSLRYFSVLFVLT